MYQGFLGFFCAKIRSPTARIFFDKINIRVKICVFFYGGDLLEKKKKARVKLGAPSKYKKEYCREMVDYFLEFVDKGEKGMPQFEVFAIAKLGVTPQTLINWRNSYADFAEAYDVCKEIQKSHLIDCGLSGTNNPRMTQFVLSTSFKMAEYSRKKPIEEKEAVGLSDGDRELLSQLEERLRNKTESGRPEFPEGIAFGEIPFEGEEETEDGGGE